VVWGIGMAQNWVMLLALPLFVGAVLWLQKLRFFEVKFLVRLTLLGLAGFSIYLLLPIVNGLAPHSPWHLGQALHASLHQTKNVFTLIYYGFWRGHRVLMFAVLIYFLVPTLPLLVRMRDEGTADKLGADRFQFWLYRALRIGLLLACIWLAFDPVVGPQELVQQQFNGRLPMLTLDYLNALGVAFLLGNLLLASQLTSEWRRDRGAVGLRQLATPIASAVVVMVGFGLLARNAPAIVRLNFHPLEQYGDSALKCLPADGGIVLSDFPERLIAFQAALSHQRHADKWLAVDSRELSRVDYREKLERQWPAGWISDQSRHTLTSLETVLLLRQVARSNHLFYLHPSYGIFFEGFYSSPTGMVYEMKLRGKDPLNVPALSDSVVESQEKYWSNLWSSQLARLVPPPAHRLSGMEKQIRKLGIAVPSSSQDQLLGQWYSISLEGWAVTLQQQGRLTEARTRLEQAAALATNNLSARISLSCNTNLQNGIVMGLADVSRIAEQLGRPDRISLLLSSGGPVDEPAVDYLLGSVFQTSGYLVQAAEQFERTRKLAPGSLAPELALAEIYNRLQMPDRSRPLVAHLHEAVKKLPNNSSLDLNVALLESYSLLLQTNASGAINVLESLSEQHPSDPQVQNRVLAAYLAMHDFTNALELVDTQLVRNPDDASVLNSKAVILMQAGRAGEAVPILNRVLMLTNSPSARMNRAFAFLAKKNPDAAESDFRALEKTTNNISMVDFGFAVIAEQRHDTNQAIQYLRECVTNTAAGSQLWRQANAKLQAFESATP